jgi:hypothetical protein
MPPTRAPFNRNSNLNQNQNLILNLNLNLPVMRERARGRTSYVTSVDIVGRTEGTVMPAPMPIRLMQQPADLRLTE